MSISFLADFDPAPALLEHAAALAPSNPFHTQAYVQAKRDLGLQPWLIGTRQGVHWTSACPAFIKQGRWTRFLEIESLPAIAQPAIFWDGLAAFIRQQRISLGEIGTYASPPVVIPTLRGETGRESRCEHLLPLQGPDFLQALSSNHSRSIRRGVKAGLQLRVASDTAACEAHAQVIGQSMTRRKQRGEDVVANVGTVEFDALVRRGAGALFQAIANDQVLSSMLILLAAKGAYYHSAGTAADGMACGASPWLVHEAARALRERGLEVFNLGGATQANAGLFRFKSEFGTTPVPLESVTYSTRNKFWATCQAAWRWLRRRN